MAGTQRISKNATNIDVSPREGYKKTLDLNRKEYLALDRTPYVYDYSAGKYFWTVPINSISKANWTQIHTWWQAGSTVKFYDDYDGAPTTFLTSLIMGIEAPLQMMWGTTWDTKFAGTLILRQV